MTLQMDTNLILIYKKMIGLNNIINDTSNNSYLNNSLTVNSNLFISNLSLLSSSVSINSNVNISGFSILNNFASINSYLNISGLTIINGSTNIKNSLNVLSSATLNSNLLITGYSYFNNNISNNSNINVSGLTTFNNSIYTNNINPYTSVLNLNASTINIGNSSSTIYINGTGSYIASSEALFADKFIALNINSTNLQGADIGISSGIQIMGISSFGFLSTTADATRYQIKSPLVGAPINYITVQDLNNNLIISGTTVLLNNVSLNSSLNINNRTFINGNISIGDTLNISGSTIINNFCTMNNSLNISGTTIIKNFCSINSLLNISGFTNINNSVSINSLLNISGSTIINSYVSINNSLNVNYISIMNKSTSINSSLNISGFTIINNYTSLNSSLNVSGSTNILGNLSINSNLFVSGMSILNNTTSINSGLLISGSSILNSSVSVNSLFQVLGQIVASLPNYDYNIDAKNAGIPVWGWYRTGGILKIRLSDIAPTIYLSGSSYINIPGQTNYTDPGAYAFDNSNNYISVYLSSIVDSNYNNYISNNILISGSSTLITQTRLLLNGLYTLTYQAQDFIGNIASINRTININSSLTPYNSSVIQVSYIYNNNYSVQPVFQTTPNLWYWTSPYNTSGFGGNGESWALSTSFLNSINFKYNSSWCFVFKAQRTYVSENWLNIEFDSNLSNWGPNMTGGQNGQPNGSTYYDSSTSYQISINASNTIGRGFTNVNYSNNGTFNTGIYINISFNYLNSTSSDNGYIKIEFCDLSGNILFTNTSSSIISYINRLIPFHMYENTDTWQFLGGVYYNSTGYVNYSTFSQYF